MPPTFIDPNQKLSEEDVKLRYITPAITERAGWDREKQILTEYYFTDGMVVVRDNVATHEKGKKVDYLLLYNSRALAIVEAKDESKCVGAGMQQALEYAKILDVPFVYSSNGHGFLEHDRLADKNAERELSMQEFPTPEALWQRFCTEMDFTPDVKEKVKTPYYFSPDAGSVKEPRYYQKIAINRTVDTVLSGDYSLGGVDRRVLLVMATGSGKTFTAFQIIYRLKEAGMAKRILYLADRNILIDQTMKEDFKPFSKIMVKVSQKKMDSAFEIYMSLYQQQVAENEEDDTYKEFSRDFFDLIIVDECHRGSANENSNWRRILEYFSSAVQIGMTATPKEVNHVSNTEYFGNPLYTYSLKDGIEDGFLAPYKVIQVNINKDIEGWRPTKGQRDKRGNPIEDKLYKRHDFDKDIVIDERTQYVAWRIVKELDAIGKTADGHYQKTMVFCDGIDHAERMRQALVNEIGGEAAADPKYVMRITGDDANGKAQLDNFNDPFSEFPAIATTSDLLTTGVNCKTCQLIVLDKTIASMTEFKQIVGRGTRLYPPANKFYFTILDFKDATIHFADPKFMGDPIKVYTGPGTKRGKPQGEGRGQIPYVPHVTGVEIEPISERVQYYDAGGKLITESFTDYTKKTILGKFATLDDFLKSWNEHEKSTVISEELELEGVFMECLRKAAGNPNMDDFDILCHLAYGTRPLTKQQRVSRVKNGGYLNKYSGVARKVLDTLLDLYSTESGDAEFADMDILQLPEIRKIGGPLDIVKEFGGKAQFMDTMSSLRKEVYAT